MENQNSHQIKDDQKQVSKLQTNNQSEFSNLNIQTQNQMNNQISENINYTNYQLQKTEQNIINKQEQNNKSNILINQINQNISENQHTQNLQFHKVEQSNEIYGNQIENQKNQENQAQLIQNNQQNMTQAFDQFQDHQPEQHEKQQQRQVSEQQFQLNKTENLKQIQNQQNQAINTNLTHQLKEQKYQNFENNQQKIHQQKAVSHSVLQQTSIKQNQKQGNIKAQQKEKTINSYVEYQNQQIKQQIQSIKKENNFQIIKEEKQIQNVVISQKKKKSKKKKIEQQSQPLPILTNQKIFKQKVQENQRKTPNQQQQRIQNNDSNSNNNGDKNNKNTSKINLPIRQQQNKSQIKQQIAQVSQIIEPSSVAANAIIFEAQKQRIGTVLNYFEKYIAKHEKYTKSQKLLIKNIFDQIQKKRISKQAIFNTLKDYFSGYASISKQFHEKSYKYSKGQKNFSLNPLINMKEQLKAGIDQLFFLRKSTGNQFQRMADFITNTIQKSLSKIFMEYWGNVSVAQNKHKQKRQQFFKKQKEFLKRINKVQKVYMKGKSGQSQQQDLFIQMTKFIKQQKQYRQSLIEYGLGLISLKKSFIKAEQTFYEDIQVLLNNFKNQSRNIYSLHKKQFTQIQKFDKLIKQNNSFQKLSDLIDTDFIRSVLLSQQKTSIQNLTDKQFQKVFNMIYLDSVIDSSTDLLKGTTSKSFDLKISTEQVVDTISGNILIFDKQKSQMKQKFIIRNITAKIVSQGVVQIDQLVKGIIFDNNRTVRITFRDNDRAQQLICFLNQIQQSQSQGMQIKK